MHLITLSLLAFGLFAKAGAYVVPDESSAINLDANANIDLDTDIVFDGSKSDVFDEYNRREQVPRPFELIPTQAETVNNVIDIVHQLNMSVLPHFEAIRTRKTNLFFSQFTH